MTDEREERVRHNQIAFWLSDEEKSKVEANIILSGLSKGEYYRRSTIGQEITVIAGNYMSARVAKVLENILTELQNGNVKNADVLQELIQQLIEINKKNCPY